MRERDGGAQVEHPVRTAELIGYHGAGEHHGFIPYLRAEQPRRLGHGVGAVGDYNAVLFGGQARL